MYKRILDLSLSGTETCFLWGPRQTGKSTLLNQLFPGALRFDLLLADVYHRLVTNPNILREQLLAAGLSGENQRQPVIIDEVQKIPALLDEVHWLIENRGLRFVLCGSSARKLKRSHANLLGGRAVRYELCPLVFPEINDFDLLKALNAGLLPRHYLAHAPQRIVQSYVGDYLQQEITAESLTRNIPAFGRFLEIAALCNGEFLNYKNIAAECGVSAPTVKEYYQILEDTLIGTVVWAYRARAKRRIIHAPKFYFFDVGVVAYLTKRGLVEPGSELFGRAFEHFIYQEILAHSRYSEKFYPITFWKTTSGFEVDFILGEGEIALEIKSSAEVKSRHQKGLKAFKEEFSPKQAIIVSLDPQPRKTEDNILILPWKEFLRRLWGNELL
jgi:predicted AAA+ superfamily ATPase